MKKVATIIVLLLTCSHGMTLADDGKGEVCRVKAKSFFENRLQRTIADRQLKELKLNSSVIAQRARVFELDGGGFAFLQNRDGQPVVIGYSDQGCFSEENMPEPMREWLENYPAQEEQPASAAPFCYAYTPVAPLLTTAWGQNEPFNQMCPTYNDVHTKAGCTAVALAQVLYYYQSANTSSAVEEYVNSATNTEISVDYSKGNYDWVNMLSTYEEGAYTDLQVHAVARLMFEAGVACHCEYGSYSTKGSQPFVALQQHYGFNCNYLYRPFVSTGMWMATIQRNLLEGKPIVYSGGSHCYIVDGIDADGLCHVNWGWSGLDDGYYDIALSNPLSSTDSYVSKQTMITDISPRKGSEQYEEKPVQAGVVRNRSWTALTSNSYTSAKYSTGCGFINMDDLTENLVSVSWYDDYDLAFPTIKIKGSNGAVVRDGNNKANIPDGIYRECLVYGDKDDPASWKVAPWPSEHMNTTEVRDGQFVVESKNDSIYIHDLQPVSEIYNGSYFYLMLDIESGKEIRGNKIYATYLDQLVFENIETGKKYVQQSGYNDPCYYPGVRYKQVNRFKPTNDENGFTMPAGTYRLLFDEPNQDWIRAQEGDEFLFSVTEKPSYPVLDVYDSFHPNQEINIKVLAKDTYYQTDTPKFSSPKLYSANDVGGDVTVNLYATREGEDEEVFICSIPDFHVNANTVSNDTYNLPVRLYPLFGAWNFTYRYLTPDGERKLLNPQALGHRVFIWQTNDYYNILEATSQMTLQNAESRSDNNDAACRVQTTSDDGVQQLFVSVRNRAAKSFTGRLKATFVNVTTGELVQAESDEVTIASGQEADIAFNVALQTKGTFDIYLDGIDTGKTLGTAVLDNTLGQRAHLTLSVGTSGIETLNKSQTTVGKTKSGIYNLQGQKVTKPTRQGLYIVNGQKVLY